MSYEIFQRAAVELMNLKVGDTVKINRASKDHENGWYFRNDQHIRARVGENFVVREIHYKYGIHSGGCYFPIFCLERVVAKPIEIVDEFKYSTVSDYINRVSVMNISRRYMDQIIMENPLYRETWIDEYGEIEERG